MAGRPIGNFPPPLIKRVWHTCCADVGWSPAIIRARPSPPTCKPFFNTRWRYAMPIRPVRSRRTGTPWPAGILINRLAERLDRPSRVPDVQRFAAHLTREFPAIWSFLFDPTIDATNWRAEHAIRPAVVTRKVWGGNRTWRGAHAQQTLGSIRTAHQRHLNPHAVLVSMLHA